MPRISVVTPTHNQEAFILSALVSVLNQTYQDFEIIITNDASTDCTLEKISELNDPRIRLFSLEHNQGESAATNHSILQATGEYIAILHSDDLFVAHKLEKQVEFLDQNPQFNAVLSYAQIIDEQGQPLPDNSHILQRTFTQPNRTRFQWLNYFFTQDNCLCQTSAMIRRRCYETVGLYDCRFRQVPDFDFWVRFCLHYDLYILPEDLTQCRVHQSNISRIHPETIIRHTTEVFQILKHYLCSEVYQNIIQIFPTLAENNVAFEAELAPFLLANQALNISRPSHQLFGLEILYNLLDQPDLVVKLEQHYRFNFRSLTHLTGKYDVFGLRPSQKLNPQDTKLSLKNHQEFPLVSLIIPTFNGEKFITEALESAVSQTYSNLEIIISDDGSTDRTLDLVNAFKAQSLAPLKVITHSNYGLVKNLNFCIEKAQGKYIKFLFQDDLLEPECVAKMVHLAEQDLNIGLVFSIREALINSDSIDNPLCQAAHRGAQDLQQDWSQLKSIQSGQVLLSDPHCFVGRLNKIGEPTTVLIPKAVFEKIGGFDPNLHQLLDVDFWFRIMGSYNIGFINQSLSKLRIHSGQQTQKNISAQENLKDYQRLFYKMLESPDYYFLSADLKQIIFCKLLAKSKDLEVIATQLVTQYCQSSAGTSTAELVLERLRELRLNVAKRWLNLPSKNLSKNLKNSYQNDLGKTHQILVESNLPVEKLTESEQQFVNLMTQHLYGGIKTEKDVQVLLAVMLYQPAYRINLNYRNAAIPQHLFEDFLRYLFDSSHLPSDSNSLQQFIRFNRDLLKYLRVNYESSSATDLWQYVVSIFIQSSNSNRWEIGRCDEHELQELLIERAKLTERYLNRQNNLASSQLL
ncbi:MAG: glycosyltransferase family 2 protein [Microcoleaceae cyanobacterium]